MFHRESKACLYISALFSFFSVLAIHRPKTIATLKPYSKDLLCSPEIQSFTVGKGTCIMYMYSTCMVDNV